MIDVDQIKSWKDFEKQFTKVIEYKVLVAYYCVSFKISSTV